MEQIDCENGGVSYENAAAPRGTKIICNVTLTLAAPQRVVAGNSFGSFYTDTCFLV